MVFSSCDLITSSTKTDFEEGPVPFEVLREHYDGICNLNFAALDSTAFNKDEYDLSKVEVIIDNLEDFDQLVTCHEDLEIDFNEYLVLAGMSRTHHQCVKIRKQEVFLANNVLFYRIDLREADCMTPEAASYMVKVPAKYGDLSIKFEIFWGN